MERPSGSDRAGEDKASRYRCPRRRRRMSSGRSPAPSERRTRLSTSGNPLARATSTSASSNASNDRTPTPDQPTSSKKDGNSRSRAGSMSTSQLPDSIRPLRRSARLKPQPLAPIDTTEQLHVNTEIARASRSPRRRGGDMQPSTSRASDGPLPPVAAVNVSNMVEPTIGVALGALGAAGVTLTDQAVQQAVRQGVIDEAQAILNAETSHHQTVQQHQQHQQLRNSLQQLASFPQAQNLVAIQSFQQPNPYPTFSGLFAPSFSAANGFPPPFYSSIGFAQPFAQDFDWRVPQMSTSTAAAAAMFAPPIYQTPISFVQQLAGHPPSTSGSSSQSSSTQHILQMPPAYSRTQRFDLHSRITQAVRSTLQHVRVLDGSRQPDPTLLENLQSNDLWRKREAVQTISNLILISDEGANLNVSFRDIVAAIKDLLQNEDFNTKSDGVTCLQNLVDVFSRSHSVAADAIPLLIALMSDVREEYGVDIHETALKPLLILSRKYGRNILQAGGLSGVLRHLYFFNQHAQRSAIEVVANAASYVTIAHIEQVGEALKEITDNMNNADSKMGDAACAAFSRIVCNLYEEETFVNDVLNEKYDLACKIVQVLRDLSTKFSATTELLKALRLLMACSSDFSAKLHHVGITSTIASLLSPLSSKRSINSFIDLRELIFMCGELAPALPDSNIFSIDRLIISKNVSPSRSHLSSWPSTSSEERPVEGICLALTAPLVAITASVTDPMVHFDVIRVLVRLLLPCRRVDLFEVLGESEYANAVMLVSLLKEALVYNAQKLYISVAAVQLIRTMLEKDSSKITAAHLSDHGIWEAVEKLGATVGNNKGGPITRNRSKALADVITSSRKRTSPASGEVSQSGVSSMMSSSSQSVPFRDDGSPSVKRERDNGGSSRSTSNISGGSKKSHLHSLLSFRSHSSDATSSTQSSRPNSPYDSQIRQLSEIDQSEVCAWLAAECSHALRLRPEPGPIEFHLEKLLHELHHKQDSSAIPLSFFKELIKLTYNCLAPNQILKSGLQEEVLKWMSDGSSTRVVPSLIAALQKVDSADRSRHLGSLIKAVAGAVDQCEAFPVSIFDLSAHAAPHLFHGAHALRYFRNHVVTITVSRHPKCDSNEPSQSNTFKTDPLVTMKYIYTVVRNRLPIRQSSSSEDDEDSQGGPFQSPDIELLAQNGQVIGEQQVLLEVLLANSTDNIGHVLAISHHFHYRPKKAGNPVRHIEPKISLEQRIREELGRSTGAEFTSLPTTSGVALVAEFLEGKRVFEKSMMKKIDRIAQSASGHSTGEPSPLAAHFSTSLGMLTLLHYVDHYWAVDGCQGYWPEHPFSIAPKDDYVCKKLDAKVNRQLADFLSVAAQGIPSWIEWIAKNAPFALSFETRLSFFRLTSFGRERALTHWLQQRDFAIEDTTIMRVKKVTIEVARENFLHFAYAALHDTPTGSTMEVKFRGEAGTGHGPTQEFYSILSREFKKASLNLWYPSRIEVDPETNEKLIASDYGLFPLPCSKEQRMEKIRLYELLGRALGQALQDGKRLDIVLSPIVMKYLIGKAHLIGPCDLATVDPLVYKSMKQIEECANEELELIMAEYSIPNVNIDISTNSSEQIVNAKNRWTYLERFRELMLLTIREPLEAIVHGLNSAFPREHLECFLPDEFEALFCGAGGADAEYWISERITEALKFDLGYSRESATVKNFVQMLTEFPPAKRQRFLQFVTGSPRLPHGGFAALSPPLTVVCKSTSSGSPDGEFPSAVTCKNYVKLPNYSSYEVMVRQFEIALTNALHFDYN